MRGRGAGRGRGESASGQQAAQGASGGQPNENGRWQMTGKATRSDDGKQQDPRVARGVLGN